MLQKLQNAKLSVIHEKKRTINRIPSRRYNFCLAYTKCMGNYAIDGFIYLCIYVFIYAFIYVFVHESQAAVQWLRG